MEPTQALSPPHSEATEGAASPEIAQTPIKAKSATKDASKGAPKGTAKATPKSVKTPSSAKKHVMAEDEEEPDTPSKKRKNDIPTSRSQLCTEDRMLLKMREDGKSWQECKAMYEMATNTKLGNSTLPNRYRRIMANLTEWEDRDVELLMQALISFEKEKWNRLSDHIATNGGGKFTNAAVEKKFNELVKSGRLDALRAAAIANGPPVVPDGDDVDNVQSTPETPKSKRKGKATGATTPKGNKSVKGELDDVDEEVTAAAEDLEKADVKDEDDVDMEDTKETLEVEETA